MNINEFMKKTYKMNEISGYYYCEIRPFLWCKDGAGLSVQGSENHYSSPRINGYQFYEVEVGYPTVRPPESWRQYSEQDWNDLGIIGTITRAWKQFKKAYRCSGDFKSLKRMYLKNMFTDGACDTIYPYISISLVEEFINLHGGIDEDKTFEEKIK